jgi:phosphoglycolate phosphatase
VRVVDRIRVAAFDLDGTLVDTAPDLAAAANVMLAAFGFAPLAQARIERLIGGGVERLVAGAFSEAAGRSANSSELTSAIDRFRQSYAEALFQRGRVYPGVVEGLRSLAALGLKLACVTNKHSGFTLPLLDATGLADWFALVLCADRPSSRKPAPDLLLAVCAHFHVLPQELLYVGDSRTDIATARAARCPVAVVDYGYLNGVSLSEEAPDWSIGRIGEVTSLQTTNRLANSDA